MHPDSIAISAEKGTASLNGIMRNVQHMGSNAEIARHGTIFRKLLLVQEDTKDLEGGVRVREAAEQYKYAALHARRGRRWHKLMSGLLMATTRLEM